MEQFAKAVAVGVLGSILAVLLRKYSKEQALLLNLATAVAIFVVFAALLKPVLSFAEELEKATGLDSALIAPVYKCVGIGLVTQLASSLCRDAGDSSIADGIGMLGTAASLYVCTPLFMAVLELIQRLLGE